MRPSVWQCPTTQLKCKPRDLVLVKFLLRILAFLPVLAISQSARFVYLKTELQFYEDPKFSMYVEAVIVFLKSILSSLGFLYHAIEVRMTIMTSFVRSQVLCLKYLGYYYKPRVLYKSQLTIMKVNSIKFNEIYEWL